MSKAIYFKIIKISIGGCLAFILASLLKLDYAISASIITLLTIQETKIETIYVAIRRFGSFIIAMILAALIFTLLGYHPIVYGIFIFFFCFFCYKFKFQDGIASSLVLTTHVYLLNEVSFNILINESMLMVIGVCIGVLLNLIMPKNVEEIKNNQKCIESIIKNIIDELAMIIVNPQSNVNTDNLINDLDLILKETKRKSIENSNNTLYSDTSYYLSYVQMRKDQSLILKHINNQMKSLKIPFKQGDKIAEFMNVISDSLHESNNAIELLEMLADLTNNLEQDDLPTSRVEFEHRALLYSLLYDIETFLDIKKDFVEQLSEEQIKRYQIDNI